jgi:hypothetical protein
MKARPVDQQHCVVDAVFDAAGSRSCGGLIQEGWWYRTAAPSSRLDAGEVQRLLPVAAVTRGRESVGAVALGGQVASVLPGSARS